MFNDNGWFSAGDPRSFVSDVVSGAYWWNDIIGDSVRAVKDKLSEENELPGPYTCELSQKVLRIIDFCFNKNEMYRSRFRMNSRYVDHNNNEQKNLNVWFEYNFAFLIKEEKLRSVQMPASPKAKGFWGNFWEALFS